MNDYQGVRKDVIDNALPETIDGRLDLFTNYINERESIRRAKESGQPFPWTEDPILRDYRFTNVRRTDDTISKWFIDNIANNSKLSLKNKIMNAILFRVYNKPETSLIMQQPITNWSQKNLDKIREKARPTFIELGKEYRQFGSAYFQSGAKRAWNESCRVHKDNPNWIPDTVQALRMVDMMHHVREDGILEAIVDAPTALAAFNAIKSIHGLGEFLAYQVWVDLTYIPESPLSEDTFTVAGPGCRLGIDMLVEDRDGMTYEEMIFHIRDNQHALDLDINFYLTVMDIENIFCEFSKYTKRSLGQSNRMRTYIPTSTDD